MHILDRFFNGKVYGQYSMNDLCFLILICSGRQL